MPDCPVCHGAGEVTSSTTPHLDPRDPFHCTRTDPCGECDGRGEIASLEPPLDPYGEYAAWEAEQYEDPIFDIALLAAKGGEERARETYGDRTVDAAITRVLSEAGW